MSSHLTQKTISGTNWGMARSFGQNVIAFFVGIVLARLLFPEDYGLLAIAMIFIQLGNIFSDFGIPQAIVQSKKLNSALLSAGFSISMLLGFFFFGVIWFAAPYIAIFFGESEALQVIRVLAIIFLFNALIGVNRGFLMRNFRYRSIFLIEIISYLIGFGFVGITLAVMGYGVWSLVWGIIAKHILLVIGYVFASRLPFWNIFNGEGYRKLLTYGGGVSLTGLFSYLANTIDTIIIGRLLNATQLGYYSKAFSVMQIPARNLALSLGGVSMSAFSSVQDEPEKLKRAFLMAVNIIFMMAAPAVAIMFISSEYLIIGIYGSHWAGAVDAFQILSLALIFKVFFGISGSLAKATNNVYAEMYRQLIYALLIGILAWQLIGFGIQGVAWAVTISTGLYFLMITQLSLRITQSRWRAFIRELKGGCVLAAIMVLGNYAVLTVIEQILTHIPIPIKLGITLILLGVIFLISFFLLPDSLLGSNREWLITTYKNKLPVRLRKFLFRS